VGHLAATVMLELETMCMEKDSPVDPVAMYIREASKVAPLSKDEETKLFRELEGQSDWDEGQENVARRLIESQLALVVRIAKRHSASGVPMQEVIEQGNIGLINAVRSFAKTPTGEFSLHAATCIENAITKALSESK
jgi:RNA polymerase primary sigma factor